MSSRSPINESQQFSGLQRIRLIASWKDEHVYSLDSGGTLVARQHQNGVADASLRFQLLYEVFQAHNLSIG